MIDTTIQQENTEDNISQISLKHFKKQAKTNISLSNIKKTLAYSLMAEHKISDEIITNKILDIHGLSKKYFDFVNTIENIINQQISDISIDQNANKNDKTIESVYQEAFNPIRKVTGYDIYYRTIKTLFGKSEAKRLTGELYNMSLAIADSTKILLPYCFAFDASKLVTEGRPFGQLQSKPAKRVSSYISALCETIHQLSSHLAGACGISTIFLDVTHLLIYNEKVAFEDIKNNKNIRKYIENEFQQFIHSVNHLSRSSAESPFSNISLFDKLKLKGLISEQNFGWYFPKLENLSQEEHINYIIDYIYEVQNIFLDLFDIGDPCASGRPYRFPVVTYNISSKKIKNVLALEDPTCILDICKREIYKYNIFTSETNKFASCCLSYDTKCEIYNGSYIEENTLEYFFNKYEGKTLYVLSDNEYSAADIIRLPKRQMYKIVTSDNRVVIASDNHRHYTNKGVKESTELTDKDYLWCVNDSTDLHICKSKSYIKIKSIEKYKYKNDYIYCFQMHNEKAPYFTLKNNIITGNCRLINDAELMELGSQVNSFGAGSSVSLGSHRVITINFNRIALENDNVEKFFKHLDMRIEDTAKLLKAHMELITLLTKKKLQPFVDYGWIRLDRLFSTFGMIGLYECVKNIQKYSDYKEYEKLDMIKEILTFFNNKVKEYSKKYNIKGNIEQIPGETMAIKLCEIDKLIFGEDKVDCKLYSNQYIPLWENVSLWERLETDGKYNDLVTGGGIVHAQIGEKITPKQIEKVIKYAIKKGCTHFALNPIYSECENNHNEFGNLDICPKCGAKIKEKYTRVVGFWTPLSSWNPVRRNWEFNNRKFVNIDETKESIEEKMSKGNDNVKS